MHIQGGLEKVQARPEATWGRRWRLRLPACEEGQSSAGGKESRGNTWRRVEENVRVQNWVAERITDLLTENGGNRGGRRGRATKLNFTCVAFRALPEEVG